MLLTKLGHACVRLEKDGARLVIDPGVWSGQEALAGASAVLVTHEHADHLDAARLRAALEADAGLRLWASEAAAAQFAGFGGRVQAVRHGDAFTAAGFTVRAYGTDHARVDAAIPVVPNTGFAVDGALFHPGDSFTVPAEPVRTLLIPVAAPWLKFAEVADYLRAVRPEHGYWIHDALLNDKGASLLGNLLKLVPTPAGPAAYLTPGSSVEV